MGSEHYPVGINDRGEIIFSRSAHYVNGRWYENITGKALRCTPSKEYGSVLSAAQSVAREGYDTRYQLDVATGTVTEHPYQEADAMPSKEVVQLLDGRTAVKVVYTNGAESITQYYQLDDTPEAVAMSHTARHLNLPKDEAHEALRHAIGKYLGGPLPEDTKITGVTPIRDGYAISIDSNEFGELPPGVSHELKPRGKK